MNKLEIWFIRRALYKKAKEDKMWQLVLYGLAYIAKNSAMIVGIIEAVAKAFVSVITLTPTKKDDKLLPYIDKFFSGIKRSLYVLSEIMSNK